MKPLTLPQIILLIIGFVLFIAIGLMRDMAVYQKPAVPARGTIFNPILEHSEILREIKKN